MFFLLCKTEKTSIAKVIFYWKYQFMALLNIFFINKDIFILMDFSHLKLFFRSLMDEYLTPCFCRLWILIILTRNCQVSRNCRDGIWEKQLKFDTISFLEVRFSLRKLLLNFEGICCIKIYTKKLPKIWWTIRIIIIRSKIQSYCI